MAPLFLFLASSFNVELVYIILKGITQFSYVICGTEKVKGMQLVKRCDNLTLMLNKIKIKNFSLWSEMKTDDQMEKKVINHSGDILPDMRYSTLESKSGD